MLLIIDNFDSFTYNLVDYFEQLGHQCNVIRVDTSIETIDLNDYSGVVISPGPGSPEELPLLKNWIAYLFEKKPLLGICLGMQAIGVYNQCKIAKAIKPMHGKLSKIKNSGHLLFKNLPSEFHVVRYHSLILENLSNSFESIAFTNIGEIMAIAHHDFPVYGLQFHPESILTDGGLEILKNWLSITGIED